MLQATSMSHYFHFSTAAPHWTVFDISRYTRGYHIYHIYLTYPKNSTTKKLQNQLSIGLSFKVCSHFFIFTPFLLFITFTIFTIITIPPVTLFTIITITMSPSWLFWSLKGAFPAQATVSTSEWDFLSAMPSL